MVFIVVNIFLKIKKYHVEQSKELLHQTINRTTVENMIFGNKNSQTLDYIALSQDVQVFILTFLSIKDIYHFSLACKHTSFIALSDETDEYIWKEIGARYGMSENTDIPVDNDLTYEPVSPLVPDNTIKQTFTKLLGLFSKKKKSSSSATAIPKEQQQTPPVNNEEEEHDDITRNIWRKRVRYALHFYFEPKSRPSDTDLVLSNYNRTVTCNRQSKWDTIRMNTPLMKGNVYIWEYHLTSHDNGPYNIYRVFVGIERSDYEFEAVGFDKIIGYNSNGISYNVGQHSVHKSFSHDTTLKSAMQKQVGDFATGDVITVVVDFKKSFTMQMFKNGEWFLTIDNIECSNTFKWYPALSLIGAQVVTINRGTNFKLQS